MKEGTDKMADLVTEQAIENSKQENIPPIKPSQYRNATYNIVSIMAYLIGVDESYYQSNTDEERPQIAIYQKLKTNKNARIIRNLCIIRTGIEKNYMAISRAFVQEFKNIGSVPDYIPSSAVEELSRDGINLHHSRPDVNQYLIDINREIGSRVNNIKDLFPEWLKWEYIRPLFIMPNGQKLEGIKAAGAEYNSNRNRYPYQCYINWEGGDNGNILHNDEKFVTLLYISHEDCFEDLSLVRDASNNTYNNIYSFIESSCKTLIVVDCENSDPIKLAACLSGIASLDMEKIHKVLLVDSNYTTPGWGILGRIPNLPIDRIVIPRIVEHKSQVDMALAARTCQEVYKNGVDSVVLVSSDSDYWALIQTLSDVDFLVMAEKGKCGSSMRMAMEDANIYYCFIDDFCTHASYSIKTAAIKESIQNELNTKVQLNARVLLDDALRETWMQMTPKEKEGFFNRYLKTLRVAIEDDGTIKLVIDN